MEVLTYIHMVASLLGILSGFVAIGGMFRRMLLNGWHGAFLTTTLAANVTGCCFLPAYGFTK